MCKKDLLCKAHCDVMEDCLVNNNGYILLYTQYIMEPYKQKPKITVSIELKEKLDALVEKKTDTYDDIIGRLIDNAK